MPAGAGGRRATGRQGLGVDAFGDPVALVAALLRRSTGSPSRPEPFTAGWDLKEKSAPRADPVAGAGAARGAIRTCERAVTAGDLTDRTVGRGPYPQ